jgi:hypothetical protein
VLFVSSAPAQESCRAGNALEWAKVVVYTTSLRIEDVSGIGDHHDGLQPKK